MVKSSQPPQPNRRERPSARRQLRLEAELHYLTLGESLALMRQRPQFQKVPLRTLEKWSRDSGWVEKRRDFLDKLRAEAISDARGELVARREKLWTQLDEILEKTMARLSDQALKARSFEGLVNATIELLRFRMDLRESLMRGVRQPDKALGRPPLPWRSTEEELQLGLDAALKNRRERQAKAEAQPPEPNK